MRFRWLLLVSSLGLLFGPMAGVGESRNGANTAGEQSGGAADLGARWKELVGDGAVWRRSDVKDAREQFIFDLVADRLKATNGEVTREQFVGMTFRTAPASSPAKASPPAKEKEAPKEKEDPKEKEVPSPEAEAQAEGTFRQLDVNNDGLLDYNEMDETLRAERNKWDTNEDGFIDLDEFKEYHKALMHQERAAARAAARPEARGQPRERIGVGARTEKTPAQYLLDLPPNLPPWFVQYDTDHDGQIGLYEWKAAGQSIKRFLELDQNGDGFLTPDEVLEGVAGKQ